MLKVILLGIVEGITEWLPISSTGHMILVDEFVKLNVSDAFMEMFLVVIQLGAILAVCVLYFHKLNPFSPKKTEVEKKDTFRLWGKVIIGCLPAAIIGLPFNDQIDALFYNPQTVAFTLILYGILFIVVENYNKSRTPSMTTLESVSLSYRMFPDSCADPGNLPFRCNYPRSGAHRNLPICGCRIFFLSFHSGHVWSQPFKDGQIRLQLHRI